MNYARKLYFIAYQQPKFTQIIYQLLPAAYVAKPSRARLQKLILFEIRLSWQPLLHETYEASSIYISTF